MKNDDATIGDKIGMWLMVSFFVVFIVVIVFALIDADKNDAEKHKFTGVCEYLEGTVEGDVCIKDGKVVHSK